jgi:protein CpxP
MKTSFFTKFLAVAVAAVMVSGAVYGQTAGSSDRSDESAGKVRGRIRAAIQSLDLSDSQRTELRGVIKTNAPGLRSVVQQLIAERRTLRGLIQAVPVNEAAIRAEAAKVAAIEADLDVQRAQLSQSIQKVLTPEQVQKFKDLQAKFDKRLEAGLDRFAKWSAQP